MQYDFYQTLLSKCLSLIIDYRGRTPKKLGLDWSDDGYRAISANNVKFSGLTKIDDIKFGNQELYDLWMKKEVKKGDLLLTSEAPSGQVMIWDSDEKIILSQRLYALRVNDNFDNKYLKYYIQSEMGQKEIIKNNSGSTVFGISAKTFDNIIVYHPIKDIQEKIGNLLYKIDKKIALNNQINARLEEMAKTLYDYWFVQFDFPDANGNPYKSSGGEMVFDETLKREIPKGWKPFKLSELVTLSTGKEDANFATEQGIYPFFTCSEKILKCDVYSFDTQAILLAGNGTFSVKRFTGRFNAYQRTYVLEPKSKNLYPIVYFVIIDNVIKFTSGSRGSIIKFITRGDIENIDVVLPNDIENMRFSEVLHTYLLQAELLEKQNHHLTQLRDFLLPMLMNGQVSVAE